MKVNEEYKQLLSLWLIQKRRSFHWKDVFLSLYFGGLAIALAVGLWTGLHDKLEEMGADGLFELMAVMLATALLPTDMMMKVFWHREPVEMDDSLRSRPVSRRMWNRFVLTAQLGHPLTWLMPSIYVLIGLVLGMSVVSLLLGTVATTAISLVNALIVCSWRRAPGNQYTLPLVFAFIAWMVVAFAYGVLVIALRWMPYVMDAGFVVLSALVGWALYGYFCRLKNYNESEGAHVSHAHSLGEVSLMSMEWVSLLRSPRLRKSVIIIAVVFLFNVYIQQATPSGQMLGVNPMLLLGVCFPSIIIGQWVLGVEANYFHGIWTRPWPLEGILQRKYYFLCLICCLMTVCILPAVIWMGMSLWTLLSALLFSCGFFVLLMMPTCFFSSRMDLFSSAFFNYQGGNKQLNAYSLVILLPIAIHFAAAFLLPEWQANTLIAVLGLIGLCLHRWFIHWITQRWLSKRYSIMERWMTE